MKPAGEQTSPLGRHVFADLHGVSAPLLTEPALIETILNEAARVAGATAIFSKFHKFGEGQGVTGVLLLRESHISIHTWPEFGFAAVDAFMCGTSRPELAIQVLRNAFMPESIRIKEEKRGFIQEKAGQADADLREASHAPV